MRKSFWQARNASTQTRLIFREALIRQGALDHRRLEQLNRLIDAADMHPEFSGHDLVKGAERDDARLVILDDDEEPVGFMTPGFDRGYWRAGAIYVDDAERGKGYAKRAIADFFRNPAYLPARVWIADYNKASQNAFMTAGFEKGERHDYGEAPLGRGCYYYKRA